jgi:hypothetical protein
MPEPTRNFCRFYPGQATWQNENSIAHMVNPIAAKSAPTAAPVVRVVQKTVFAFKKRPVIAPKGLQKGKFISAINQEGVENGESINRVVVTIELENKHPNGNHFVLTKNYNILPSGRGFSAFTEDFNAWTGAGLTEDDLYTERDYTTEFGGSPLVVQVGRRKDGKEWLAVIEAFHPEGYMGEAVEA